MVSTYTTNGGIEKIGSGEQSGTWGDTTNTNFDIVDKLTNGVIEIDVGSGATSNLDTTDGTVTNGMSKVLIYKTSGTQSSAHTVTISRSAAQKIYFVRNTLNQNLQFIQGGSSASDCVVAAGTSAIIYAKGASGGAGTRVANLSALLPNTDTAGAGTFTSITANGGVNVDNITIDGTEIDLSSGDLTVDVEGNIDFDAKGGTVKVSSDGTEILNISNDSGDVVIKPVQDAKDIIFKQRDGTEVARIKDDGTFNIVTDKLAINGTPVTSSAAELNILDTATVTAGELNLLDGDTANDSSITVADGDGILVDDNGTMKKVPASDIKTYATAGATSGTVTGVTGTDPIVASNSSTTPAISLKNDFIKNVTSAVQQDTGVSSYSNNTGFPVFITGVTESTNAGSWTVTIGGSNYTNVSTADGSGGTNDQFAFFLPHGASFSISSGTFRYFAVMMRPG